MRVTEEMIDAAQQAWGEADEYYGDTDKCWRNAIEAAIKASAAPDVLTVLRKAVQLYEQHGVPAELVAMGWTNVDTEWVKEARQAIAEAIGE